MPRIPGVQPVSVTNLPPLSVAEIERTGLFMGAAAQRGSAALVGALDAWRGDLETKVVARNDLEARERLTDLRERAILQPDSDVMRLTFEEGAQEISDEILSRTPNRLRDQIANQISRSVESGRLNIMERALRRRRGEALQLIAAGNDQALIEMGEATDLDEVLEIISSREAVIGSFLASGSIEPSDAEAARRDLMRYGARNEALRLIHASPQTAREQIATNPWISANLQERDRLVLELPLAAAEERDRNKRSKAIAASIGGDGSLTDSDYLSLTWRNESNKNTNVEDRIALAELGRTLEGQRGAMEKTAPNIDAVDATWNEFLADEDFSFHELDVLDRAQMTADYTATAGIAPRTYIKQLKADLMSGRSPLARGDAAIILDRIETMNPGAFETTSEERVRIDRLASNIEAGMSHQAAVENMEAGIEAMQGRDPAVAEAAAIHAIQNLDTRYNSASEYAQDTSLFKQQANQVGSFGFPFTGLLKEFLGSPDVTRAGERGIRVEFFAERLAEISQLGTEMRDGWLRAWSMVGGDDEWTGTDFTLPVLLAMKTYQAISEGEPEIVPQAMLNLIDERSIMATIANGGDAVAGIQTGTKEALSPNMFGWSSSRATHGVGQVEWVRYAPELHFPMHWRNAKGAALIREQAASEALTRLGITGLNDRELQEFEDSILITWMPSDGFRSINGVRTPVYYLMRKGNPLSDDPDKLNPTPITDQFGRLAPWVPDPQLLPDKVAEKADLALREERAKLIAESDRVLYQDALANEGWAHLPPMGPVYIPRAKPVDPAILTEEAKLQQEAMRSLHSPLWSRYLARVLGNDQPADMSEIESELLARGRDITSERELTEKTARARAFVQSLREAREESARRGF
jgi:hypothetical protein